jgi:hypothetical protein
VIINLVLGYSFKRLEAIAKAEEEAKKKVLSLDLFAPPEDEKVDEGFTSCFF